LLSSNLSDFLVISEDDLLGLVKFKTLFMSATQANLFQSSGILFCYRHMLVFYGEAVLGQAVLSIFQFNIVIINKRMREKIGVLSIACGDLIV
jgi:hypothetical protein